MKTIAAIGMLLLVGGIAVYVGQQERVTEYTNTHATTTVNTVVEDVQEEKDILEEAQRELDRINTELDAEETRILEEIEALEAEKATKQQRLDEIHKMRASFL